MRKGIPDSLKRWLGMGGRVFWVWSTKSPASPDRDAPVGYVRAYNRSGALRIAKAAGVFLGAQMLQREIAEAVELGVAEVGGKEVWRGGSPANKNPRRHMPSRRAAMPSRGLRRNPSLVVLGNPGRGAGKTPGSRILSNQVIEIRYKHAEDGKFYKHKFERSNSCIECLSDGSFRIYNMAGHRLWGDY